MKIHIRCYCWGFSETIMKIMVSLYVLEAFSITNYSIILGKAVPQLAKATHRKLEMNCIFMLEPSAGPVMPVRVSWETMALKKSMHFSLSITIHKTWLKKFMLTAPPL